jgi:hypothetical protein
MTQEDINEVIAKSTPEWRNRQIRSEGEYLDLQSKYYELLYAVSKKYPGESRHQTALTYIQERNTGGQSNAAQQGDEKK